MNELSSDTNDVKKISSYYSSFFGREYDLLVSFKPEGDIDKLWIQMQGENLNDMILLKIDMEQVSLFRDAIIRINEKYVQWCDVANVNNVKSFRKAFDVVFPEVAIGWYDPDKYKWYFDMNHKLTPHFVVLESGKCTFVMTGSAVATVESLRNEEISNMYYFALSSESDFEIFLREIDPVNLLLKSAEKILESSEKIKELLDTYRLFK